MAALGLRTPTFYPLRQLHSALAAREDGCDTALSENGNERYTTNWQDLFSELPRETQREFIARGLASLEDAEKSGLYFDSEEVMSELEAMLLAAERNAR